MEQAFLTAWQACREKARALGVRLRPAAPTMQDAHRALSGSRPGEGFYELADKNRLELSLEALAIDRRFTGLFSDEEANAALSRLLEAGYSFPK